MPKCMLCRKSLFRCKCNSPDTPGKVKKEKGTGNITRGGIVWCGSCQCRVINGTCTNKTCSTHSTGVE